ncbi:murein DD-endopeptidase MepM/ murein hydrolase activator NlpD [Marmoricola sp. URHA0025 HA25]
MKLLALFSAPGFAVLALLFGVVVVLAPVAPDSPAPALDLIAAGCVPQPPDAVSGAGLDVEQWAVARTVIEVGKSLDVSPRGWVVALAAGMQESGLRPLRYGDRDSLGVFQQRAVWGTVAERVDPASAARMFYTGGHSGQRGLLDIPGWEHLSVTVAAQAVQVSAYPDAYAKWEPLAISIVATLTGADGSCHPGDDNPTDTSAAPNGQGGGAWVLPVGHAHYVLTAGFGECGSRWAHCHTGQDFAVPTGTPIMVAADGVVTFAGWAGPYGNAVHVLHAGGIATWYAHLSQIRTHTGAHVTAGQVLGLSGSTGNTTGPHLHLEVRTHASTSTSGTPIDPMPWLHAHHVL